MATKKQTREEQIAKILETVENAVARIYADKPKANTHAAAAQASCLRAIGALKDAQSSQRLHSEMILAQIETLKSELMQ